MIRFLTSLAIVALALSAAQAQTLDDALRYSETFPLGTARSLGVSNSMSAIGADYTAVSGNPAGLAAFRRNDLTLTFGPIITGSNNASLDGGPVADAQSGTDFALPQVGLVLTRRPIASKWTQLNFGLGVSQANRFEERLNFSGTSPGSVTDVWLDEANLYALDEQGRRAYDEFNDTFFPSPLTLPELSDFSTGLAFDAGVLIPGDDTDAPPFYQTDYDNARGSDVFGPGAPLEKEGSFARTGRTSTFDLSVAGNYDERFMIGATLGISRFSYESVTNYREDDAADAVPAFERLAFNQFVDITGTGVQLRVGAIYRASQALRLGLAYHSPTRYSVTDSYNANLRYIYRDLNTGASNDLLAAPDQPSVIEYRFTTPSQYKASAALLLGKRGFVSTELTYLNFAGGSFDIDDQQDTTINRVIDQSLQGALQARFGGEVNLDPLKLRAGFQYVGAPIVNEDAVLGVTGGVGFRQNRLGLDLGYQLLLRPDRTFIPYRIEPLNFPEPAVAYTPISHTLALTVGWKLVPLE